MKCKYNNKITSKVIGAEFMYEAVNQDRKNSNLLLPGETEVVGVRFQLEGHPLKV